MGFMCEGDQQLRRIGVDRQKRKKNVLNTLEYSSLVLFGFVDVLKILKWSSPGFHPLDFASQSRVHSLWDLHVLRLIAMINFLYRWYLHRVNSADS